MPRRLTNPRLLKEAVAGVANAFPTPCSRIYTHTTQDPDTGEQLEADYIEDSIMYCAIEAYNGVQEVRRQDQTLVLEPVMIVLNGYYPELTVKDKIRAFTDREQAGYTDYGIVAVQHDSTSSITTVMAEKVTTGPA